MFEPINKCKTIDDLMSRINLVQLNELLNDLRMFRILTEDEIYMIDRFKKYNLSYEAYIDFYILLQCANTLSLNVEEVRDNISTEELIYFYGSEYEADIREYQLKKFKEVFKC